MICQQSGFTLPAKSLGQIAEQGFDAMPELIRIVTPALVLGASVNAAVRIESQNYLGVAPYERSPEQRGHGNGLKPKTERTRLGELEFAVPQVSEGGFYPQALVEGLRSERAMTLELAEMYVQGVSTGNVRAIAEELRGSTVSSSQVSCTAALLDEHRCLEQAALG